MVFQDLRHIPALTVAENIALAPDGCSHADRATRAAVVGDGVRFALEVDPDEVDALFAMVDELWRRGLAVVLITHKLREARADTDRLPVLRGGKTIVDGVQPDGLDDDESVEAMVGRTVRPLASAPGAVRVGEPALQVRGVDVGHSDALIDCLGMA